MSTVELQKGYPLKIIVRRRDVITHPPRNGILARVEAVVQGRLYHQENVEKKVPGT